jgi:hypothetical protein
MDYFQGEGVNVSTLAVKLGLPKDADNAACLARIDELKRVKGISRAEVGVKITALEAKFGMARPEDVERDLLAKELGNGLFELHGRVLTADELQAEVERDYADAHAFDDVEPREALTGVEIDKAATKLLASRGIWDATGEQYLAACREVGAK